MRKRFKFVVRLSDDIPLWYEIQYCACYLLYLDLDTSEGSGKRKVEAGNYDSNCESCLCSASWKSNQNSMLSGE